MSEGTHTRAKIANAAADLVDFVWALALFAVGLTLMTVRVVATIAWPFVVIWLALMALRWAAS